VLQREVPREVDPDPHQVDEPDAGNPDPAQPDEHDDLGMDSGERDLSGDDREEDPGSGSGRPWSDDEDPGSGSDRPWSDDDVGEQRDQDRLNPGLTTTYPFDTVMQGLLAFTFITTPLTSQRKRDSFLLCVNTPQCGNFTWNGSSRTIGRRLSLLPHPVAMKVTANCRVRDFAAEEIRRAQDLERGFVRQAKLRLFSMKDLPIVAHCPIDALKRHLADPILAAAMRFGLEDPTPGGPTEWNQTPFAHQHLLYQKLLSFWTAGHEYRKGDFVEMRGTAWNVVRIDGMEFRRASDDALMTPDDEAPRPGPGLRDDLQPRLWLKLRRTTPGRHFHQSGRNNLQPIQGLLANHEVFVPLGGDVHYWAMAEGVEKPVLLNDLGPKPVGGSRETNKAWDDKRRAAEAQVRAHRATKGVYVCRHSYDLHDRKAEDDLKHDMYSLAGTRAYVQRSLVLRTPCLDNEEDRVIWYSLFVDKYHMHNSQRDGSYNAVYMQVFNCNKTFRNSHVTLIVLAVLPGGANLYTASRGWQQKLRAASIEGFDAWSFVDKRVRKYHVVLWVTKHHVMAGAHGSWTPNDVTSARIPVSYEWREGGPRPLWSRSSNVAELDF
jgi:hypothetical protein